MTMRKTTMAALAAALVAGGAGLAVAQTAQPPGPGAGPGWHRGDGPRHHGPRGERGGFAMGEAFARADANNDGKVTRDEAMAWLQARFTEADANHDGAVTLEEFRAMRQAQRPEGRRQAPEERRERMGERLGAMFRFVDANGDGRVTFDELRPMGEAAFRAMDRNSDGVLTRDEVRPRGPQGRRAPPAPMQQGGPAAPAAPAQPSR